MKKTCAKIASIIVVLVIIKFGYDNMIPDHVVDRIMKDNSSSIEKCIKVKEKNTIRYICKTDQGFHYITLKRNLMVWECLGSISYSYDIMSRYESSDVFHFEDYNFDEKFTIICGLVSEPDIKKIRLLDESETLEYDLDESRLFLMKYNKTSIKQAKVVGLNEDGQVIWNWDDLE